MMREVLFAGGYGLRSQGDDAGLVVLARGLAKVCPGFRGGVICRHAEEDLYAGYGLRSIQNFEYDSKADSLGKWFRGFNYDDDRTDLRRLQKEIEDSDLLVLGAGNAFVDVPIGLLHGLVPYFAVLTLMAKMVGTPVMWYGISVGPLRTEYGRNLTRLSAELAAVVSVRDERSIKELRELGWDGAATALPDPVLGLLPSDGSGPPHPAKEQAHQRGGPVIAVSVRSLRDSPSLSFSAYLTTLAEVCDCLAQSWHASLLFIPQCTYSHGDPLEDDREVAAEVVRRMAHGEAAFVVADQPTIEETTALYAGSAAALCTRLHGNVSAAIEGVPPVAMDYNPKVASFMNWLGCPIVPT